MHAGHTLFEVMLFRNCLIVLPLESIFLVCMKTMFSYGSYVTLDSEVTEGWKHSLSDKLFI